MPGTGVDLFPAYIFAMEKQVAFVVQYGYNEDIRWIHRRAE